MNKNIKIAYHFDKFKDYSGVEREFIIAAVSVPFGRTLQFDLPDPEFILDCGCFGNEYETDMEKYLLIGISVRNKEDKYDEEIGKKIAVGKAMRFKGKQIIVSHSGLVNTKVVKALLEQEAEYFKRDPQSYIAGYRNAERKWKERHS